MKKLVIVFLIVIAWLQYRLWSPEGGISEWVRLQNELAIAQAQIEQLQQSNDALKNLVLDLQNNTDAVETQARSVLHFAAPDETFFRVITIPKHTKESYSMELPLNSLTRPQDVEEKEEVSSLAEVVETESEESAAD